MKATTKQLCAFANLKRVAFQYPLHETFFYCAGEGEDTISMFVPSLDDVYIISMSSEFAFKQLTLSVSISCHTQLWFYTSPDGKTKNSVNRSPEIRLENENPE